MTKAFIILITAYVASLIINGILAYTLLQAPRLTNPEYLKGYTLDLPEEITVMDSSKTDLEGFRSKDTIFIQFK